MNLRIGENIRRLRRERNLTQEEVAAHLGIFFQSVSKWERCDGYPDITMLPALAHYFGVSVDALIGMDQMAKAEKYDEVNRLWKENNRRGRHQENVVLMRDSLRTFPNDGLLLVQLSTSLEKLDGTKEEKAKYLRESIALQEQILRYGEDSQVRSATQYNICFSYWKNGEQKKALEQAGIALFLGLLPGDDLSRRLGHLIGDQGVVQIGQHQLDSPRSQLLGRDMGHRGVDPLGDRG